MPDNLIESGRAGAHAACAHVSPAPLYHSVRRVCPSTVGSAAFYREPFRLAAFDPRSASTRPTYLMSRRYYPLAGPSPYGRRSQGSRRRPQALGSTRFVMSGSAFATTA